MSLPRETLDLLLSGYMDEALSKEEHAQVEELLRSDPDVAGELEELRELRNSLRSIANADRNQHIPEGFADRVLEAAVAQARAEGLEENHPVVRLTEQPSSLDHVNPQISVRRAIGLVAALAASIILAVFVLRPDNASDPSPNVAELAKDDSQLANSKNGLNSDAMIAESADVEIKTRPPEADDRSPSPSMLAESIEPKSTIADAGESPPTRQIDDVSRGGRRNNMMARDDSSAEVTDEIANKLKPAGDDSMDRIASARGDAIPRQLGAVMVLDVRRTESGRISRSVRRAMTSATIRIENEKLVTEDIVSVASQTGAGDDDSFDSVSILYLEGSAKELDRFINELFSDREGIDSVRFGLASELPILNMAKNLQRPLDPTTVRHSASWIVEGSNVSASRALTKSLGDRTMVPLSGDVAEFGIIGGAMAEDGPDVMSQMFILVH